ncbi:MAG: hypothetical protein HC817_14570 [Saprospiraceae bacterium]|nr:hypothetical protein [Saprospiraceae bacterium]
MVFPQSAGDAAVTNIIVFRVFNRWGNKVFERYNFNPNVPEMGWDGIFKGQQQPSDVYTWMLEAEFLDKTKTPEPLKGSVFLVR